MTDATGHRDRTGVDPLNSTGITMNGIPTNHYQFQNPQTGKFEVVKVMPAGTPDEVVREFDSFLELQNWVNDQWNQHGYLS